MPYEDLPPGMRLIAVNAVYQGVRKGGAPSGTGNGYTKAVCHCTEDGRVLSEYVSAHEAARSLNCSQSGISLCCNGKSESHKGMYFKFKEKANAGN